MSSKKDPQNKLRSNLLMDKSQFKMRSQTPQNSSIPQLSFQKDTQKDVPQRKNSKQSISEFFNTLQTEDHERKIKGDPLHEYLQSVKRVADIRTQPFVIKKVKEKPVNEKQPRSNLNLMKLKKLKTLALDKNESEI